MSDTEVRNIQKYGILINVMFFCRALGIKRPKYVSDAASFMEGTVEKNSLEWSEIARRVEELRSEYREKRKKQQNLKKQREREKEEAFLGTYRQVSPKERNCLSCDTRFLSISGNRLCSGCRSRSSEIEE
jgi:hypothetical protein